LVGLQFGGQAPGAVAFPAGDGIEHLGAFLRALNAFYDLRDCERLIDEAVARIQLGVSHVNPVQHCQFNLTHVAQVLHGSDLPRLHLGVQIGSIVAGASLEGIRRSDARAARGSLRHLAIIKALIRGMRDSIATQVTPP
jgi:hypothetical protein